jgi:hypothetical protein
VPRLPISIALRFDAPNEPLASVVGALLHHFRYGSLLASVVGVLLHHFRYDSLLASVVGVLLHHFHYDSLQLNN